MSLELNPRADLAGAKFITLAGKQYPVPPLSLRQIIGLGRQLPKVSELTKRSVTVGAGIVGEDKLSPENAAELSTIALDLTEVWIEVVRIGLSVAHPAVNTDDILSLRTSPKELSDAGEIIVGLGGAKAVPAGEPTAASA